MNLNLKEIESTEKHTKKRNNVITHLKYLRKRTGYTLEQLAQVTGISVSYLSRLESGARRLNTDLIRRLSKAFGCDPAELLQDTVHDESILISTAARKLRNGFFAKDSRKDKKEYRIDLPVYKLDVEGNNLTIDMNVRVDVTARPMELDAHEDAIAMLAEKTFTTFFPEGSKIFLNKETTCIPENIVVAVMKDNTVLLRKVWSVTPNSIQLCELSKFEDLKSGKIKNNHNILPIDSGLLEITSDKIASLYSVVGYIKG